MAYDVESDRIILVDGDVTKAYDYNTDTWETKTNGGFNSNSNGLAYIGYIDRILLADGDATTAYYYYPDTW